MRSAASRAPLPVVADWGAAIASTTWLMSFLIIVRPISLSENVKTGGARKSFKHLFLPGCWCLHPGPSIPPHRAAPTRVS